MRRNRWAIRRASASARGGAAPRLAPILALFAGLALSAMGPASAQETVCDDPAEICGRLVAGSCLQKRGAGVVAAAEAPSDCEAQFSRYVDCLAEAAECDRADAPDARGSRPVRDRCTPYVEQTLFEAARRNAQRQDDFRTACPQSPLIALLPDAPDVAPRAQTGAAAIDADTTRVRRELRSHAPYQLCADAAGGPLEVRVRVWRRTGTQADQRVTVEAPSLPDPAPLRAGQALALRADCALQLERTGFKGFFFAEVVVSATPPTE